MSFSLVPEILLQRYEEVTPDFLRQRGITLLLTDLDYTLAPRSVREPDEGIFRWIAAMKAAGIQVMIISNNRSPLRVEQFCSRLQIPYVGHAGKPGTRGLEEAMARAGVLALMVEPRGGAVSFWQKVLHALQSPFKRISKKRSAQG